MTTAAPWQRYPIVSDQHGYVAGLVVGLAMKNGLDVEPILDPEGNYTAAMWLKLPEGLYGSTVGSVVIVTSDPESA